MRIASMDLDGIRRFGRVDGAKFAPLAIDQNPLDLLSDNAANLSFDTSVEFLAAELLHPPLPVTSMRDFITFEQHTAGALRSVNDTSAVPDAWYEAPAFYFTNPHAAIGSGHDVPMPPGCDIFDFELEVGAVIGRDGYNLSVEEAWNHLGGLTIFNDWSARDLQQREMRVGLGPAKGKDTATTLGPVIVTTDELDESRDGDRFDLAMEVHLNGVLLGSDSLANMAWSFAELISYASRGTWVRRGDIIGSGTAGQGCLAEFWGWAGERTPPPLAVGDQVAMSVAHIGTISNRVIAGPPLHEVPVARRIPWQPPR